MYLQFISFIYNWSTSELQVWSYVMLYKYRPAIIAVVRSSDVPATNRTDLGSTAGCRQKLK